jgi:hypothetical protein
LKLNEIRSVIKLGNLIRREQVAEEVFAVKHFYNGYENLIQMSKYLKVVWAKFSTLS